MLAILGAQSESTLSRCHRSGLPKICLQILDPLSDIVTYPSGARRRAGARGDRAIAIAGRDARRGRWNAIYAEGRDAPLWSRALDGGRLSYDGDLQIVLSASAFSRARTPARVRPRKIDKQWTNKAFSLARTEIRSRQSP